MTKNVGGSTGTRFCLRTAFLLSSMLGSVGAYAQDAGGAAPEPEAPMADIVVTAQHRSESLQNVPISILAIDTAKLAEHQVVNVDDYVKLLPSVSYQSFGPGQAQTFFRGVSSGSDGLHGGSLPTVGTYLDNIPITSIGGTVDFHVYDVARVEALAGPQGTLYGASSLAGTLRIITNKPDTTHFAAGYDVQGSKFGKGGYGGSFDAFVNLPLSDRLALRVVGFYDKTPGYIDNLPATRTYTLGDANPANDITINNARFARRDYNDVESFGGRAALKIDLDDNWIATPSIVYQQQRSNGAFLTDPKVGDLQVNDFTPEGTRDHWYQAALTIEGKLSDWDVVYSGGYFQRSLDTQSDYSIYTVVYDSFPGYTKFPTAGGGFVDPTQRYVTSDRYTKHTQELRLSSPQHARLRGSFGLFYQRQSDDITQNYRIDGLSASPGLTVPNTVDNIYYYRAYRVDRDYAAFGELSFDLLDNLTLNAGLRGFMAKNTSHGYAGLAGSAAAANCIPVNDPTIPCQNFTKKYNQSGETHRVNLTWKIDPERMLYATWSTGFRPGGNNRRAGINPYPADTLTNYEIGWKTSWFNRTLRINGAAFLENWNNLQYALSPVGSAGITNTYSAGNARIKGVEADIAWRIGHLTLSGAGTYVDARLSSPFCQINSAGNNVCTPGVAPTAPNGTRLPVQPRFKMNATARYELDLGGHSSFVQAAMLHQSSSTSRLSTNEQNALGSTPAFTTFDFSAGTSFGNANIELFIQNAFDERGILSINTLCSPTICGVRPRYYTVKPQYFGIRFGQRF